MIGWEVAETEEEVDVSVSVSVEVVVVVIVVAGKTIALSNGARCDVFSFDCPVINGVADGDEVDEVDEVIIFDISET